MQLITSNRHAALPAVSPEQKWLPEIYGKYGDFEQFSNRFRPTPEVQEYSYSNVARAMDPESGMQSMIRFVKAYGKKKITSLLGMHLTTALVLMGEDRKFDAQQIRWTAAAIAGCTQYVTLKFSTVLGFFHFLRMGEFQFFGEITPNKIMNAYQQYCARAREAEIRERERLERELEEQRRIEHDAKCRPWEEHARRLGLPPGTSFREYCTNPEFHKPSPDGDHN